MVNYKYLIINEQDEMYYIMNSFREIEKYINEIYPENKTSHMSVARRLKESEKKYYKYNDIIVKELLWELNEP
jgi:hypothetical protein|tara:strand:- start:449 stop:667 length:219 start_codon:yes stop_codon:yes gene_type:complete